MRKPKKGAYSAGMNLSRARWGGGGVVRGRVRKGPEVPSIHNPKVENLDVLAVPPDYNRAQAERFLQIAKLRTSRIQHEAGLNKRAPKAPVAALFSISSADEVKYIIEGGRPFPKGHPLKDMRLAFRPSMLQQLVLDERYGGRNHRRPQGESNV